MGDDDAPPAQPAAPDYSALYAQGVGTNIATLPAQRQIDQAAQLGTAGSVYIPGYGQQSYDFTGMGNDALTAESIKNEASAADSRASYTLGLEQKYGQGFVDQEKALTREADPAAAALRDDYMKTTQSNYDLGSTLDDSTRREVEQGARGAQAARGNILGDASAYDEAMQLGQAGENRQLQRTAEVQSALGLAPVSSQFGSVNQATGPAPVNGQFYSGQTTNPNAGSQGAQFGLGEFGTEAGIYGTESQNYQNAPANPWMTLAGTAIGAAAGTAAHMI